MKKPRKKKSKDMSERNEFERTMSTLFKVSKNEAARTEVGPSGGERRQPCCLHF
jgi:hypothetical protein